MKTPSTFFSRLVFVFLFCLGTLVPSRLLAAEFRGLWVDAYGSGFLTATEVTKLVNDCRTYNFNAIIVQMRRRGDAFYMPQAPNGDPRTTVLSGSYDALQELITQCHNSTPRIEVHCWVTANVIWSDTTKAPTQAGHLFNLHPEYLTKSIGGNNEFSEGYYLDPGHPDAMQWNYNMARDITSHYDIDGFHWDYIRYPQQDSGFNDTAIARYNAEFGLTGLPSASSSQFSTWRRRQVTDFVRWVNADLLEIKPSLILSASVFANRSDAKNSRFQDWAAWNSEGIIDICFPMNYTADNSLFTSRLDDAFANAGVRVIYSGLGAYLNTKENTVVQLNSVRNKPGQGSVLFSYRTPNSGTVSQSATFQYVKDNFQAAWTETPVLPWVANPTNGIVKGTVRRTDDGAAIYNAKVTLTGAATQTQKTEPHGKYALFEVAPGTYTINATSGGVNSASTSVTVTAGGVHNVDLEIALPLVPDTTAPVISAVRVSSISSNSCVITWTTGEASDSTVDYGLTTDYENTADNSAPVVNHSVTLTGLNAATTYHYRVNSADAAGNSASSADGQFATPPAQSDIIIDNPDATMVGSWALGTSATDKFGSDYRSKGKGTGSTYLQFAPSFQVGGNYQVFEWHSAGSNRATNVPVIVTSYVGTQTYFVNQQSNGGKWNYVGTFYFPAGMSGNVKITDGFADATAGRVAIADAIRFTWLPDQTVSDIVIDNPAAAVTGSWSTQSTSTDKFGADYRFKSRGTGTGFLTFAPSILVAGDYQVYEWHPAGSNRALNAPHVINHALGAQSLAVNQQINGGKWNLLGTFGLSLGTGGNIRITDGFATPTNGVVMADAIKLTYIPPPAPPSPPSDLLATATSTTEVQLSWNGSSSGINFIIGRSEISGGPYTDIAVIPANTTSYQDTGLTPGTTYFYVVRAVGAGGPSNNSTEASVATLPLPPVAPSSLTATAVSSSQIDLSWTDGESLDSVYIISRSSSPAGPFADIASQEVRFTTFSDTGLTAETTYYYQVRAHNNGGDSAQSNMASATTPVALPAAPSDLLALAVSPTQINLTWRDNAANEDSFTIFRSDGGSDYVVLATLPANSAAYSDTTVRGHTTYFYTVRVSNSAGSALSDAVSVTTPNSVPMANAGDDQTLAADANCQATVTLNGANSSDPDQDALSYTWSGPFGTVNGSTASVFFSPGTHVVTLTVADGHGGTASDTVSISVADTTAPVLTLNGANPMTIECHSAYNEPGASATDGCAGDLNSAINVSGSVNADAPGSYTQTYTVSDPSGNVAVATRTINVVDTTAPTLLLNGDVFMTIEAGSAFVDPGATASDVCAGNLTALIQVSGTVNPSVPGTNFLSYTVTDPSGHVSAMTRTVTVVDTTAPVIAELKGSQAVIAFVNHKMVPIGIDASTSDIADAHPDLRIVKIESNEPVNGAGDGDTSPDWEITGALTCNLRAERAGNLSDRIYTITVQSTDDYGNSASSTVKITVPHDARAVASR